MKIWFGRLARLTIILLAIATFVGVVAADAWWIRVFDFPRLQFAILLAVAIGLLVVTRSKLLPVWGGIAAISLGFQIFQIYPYSPLVAPSAIAAQTCSPQNNLRLLVLNVLQKNTDYAATIALVEEDAPDVFLAMETDVGWTDALSAALSDAYPHQMLIPQDNTYGMALYSRLPLRDEERNDLSGGGTPSIKTRVILPSDKVATIFAVHPKPPHPGQDSGQRDAELIMLADLVRESGRPTLVVGDFNDVPWSRVTETFQATGGLVDPRVGRGFMATFDASNPLMRWPLDHLFYTDDFAISRYEVGRDVGSDHFPLHADLCLDASRFAPRQEAPELDSETLEDAREELLSSDVEGAKEVADDLR